jgi:anti-sigma-K factor RskA
MTEEENIDGLAAEYVLGSLDAAERADVEARRTFEGSLRAAIEAWERRLAPLLETAPEVGPPADLLDRILVRIADEQAPARRAAPVLALRNAAQRRMRLALSAGALAACLALAIAAWFLYAHPSKPKGEVHVAAMDCGGLYKNFWGKLDREKYARIPAEQLAGVSRMALRAYDACQAGDQLDAASLFGRLERMNF